MFGDKPIVGCEKRIMDYKGRLVLPAFTWAEFNEKDLSITKVGPVNGAVYIMVQKSTKLREKIQELEELKAEAKSAAERNEIYQQLVDICLNTSTLDASVDGQRRIRIPSKLCTEVFCEGQDIVCQGAYDSLYIFPSVQSHDEFTKSRK